MLGRRNFPGVGAGTFPVLQNLLQFENFGAAPGWQQCESDLCSAVDVVVTLPLLDVVRDNTGTSDVQLGSSDSNSAAEPRAV